MKFSDFRKGDLVFSDENKRRVWTVLETSTVGVMLLCTHFRNGDKVGKTLSEGKYNAIEPQWFTGNPNILHIVRTKARVV